MCGLSELTRLQLYRPGPDATSAEVAAYRARQAAIHAELAVESAGADATRELHLAERFRARATHLT